MMQYRALQYNCVDITEIYNRSLSFLKEHVNECINVDITEIYNRSLSFLKEHVNECIKNSGIDVSLYSDNKFFYYTLIFIIVCISIFVSIIFTTIYNYIIWNIIFFIFFFLIVCYLVYFLSPQLGPDLKNDQMIVLCLLYSIISIFIYKFIGKNSILLLLYITVNSICINNLDNKYRRILSSSILLINILFVYLVQKKQLNITFLITILSTNVFVQYVSIPYIPRLYIPSLCIYFSQYILFNIGYIKSFTKKIHNKSKNESNKTITNQILVFYFAISGS